jgi:hypothetical protein
LSRRAVALLAAVAAVVASAARELPRKKLIEWGWDEPDTAFLRAHIAEMEKTPFDGCVYHAIARTASGPVNLTWHAWGRRAFREEELRQASDDLRSTRLVRFRSSFLRFNVTPAKLDWYDDHQAVLQNARLAARLARLGRSAGIALDTEQYEGRLFDYARQRDAGGRSFADYSAQARRRGRELMEAFEEGYPGLTLLLSFGHSYVYWLGFNFNKAPPDNPYGLLAPFVDGLVEGARAARIVDGHERSYWFKEPERFRGAYQLMRDAVPRIAADPASYRRKLSFGFGIWMDYEWRRFGWNTADPRRNYFSPQALYVSARAALETADEYVWIYTEQPRWWSPGGGPVKLPSAYDAALRRARRDGAGLARRPR